MFSTFASVSSIITKKVGSLIGTNWTSKLDTNALGITITTMTPQTGTVIETDTTGQYILALGRGASNKICVSNDFGATWTTSGAGQIGVPASNFNPCGCGVSGNGATMYVCIQINTSGGSIYKSTNYGVSWTQVTNAPSNLGFFNLSVSSDGNSILCASATTGATTLMLSTNGGTSFANIASNSGMNVTNNYWKSFAISPDGSKIIGCGRSGGVFHSSDGGASWTNTFTTLGSTVGQSLVSNTGKAVLTTVGQNAGAPLSVYVYDGTTWTGITSTYIPVDKTLICSASDDLSVILVSQCKSTNNGYLYISRDGGATFQELTAFGSSFYQAVGVSGDGKYIFCAGTATNSKNALYSSFN